MRWTPEAEAAVKKVPFFVRKKVRRRVEDEAAREGKTWITVTEVKATQKRFLNRMGSDIKGYQLDICFGPNGCPNRAIKNDGLLDKIEKILKASDLLTFLRSNVNGPLKYHHEFRISVAECPNSCSQPQIKDIGIIAAGLPIVTDAECTMCEACVECCPDKAIRLEPETQQPDIDALRCQQCGKCIQTCPTATIAEQFAGYRIQLGGKLGRHPQLARELAGIYNESELLSIIELCINYYKQNSRGGQRFATILSDGFIVDLNKKYNKNS